MTNHNKAILVMFTAILVYILAVVQRMSPPVVAVEIMNDLNLNPANMSLMFSLTMIGYGIMQPLAGFWADRFGPRHCLMATAIVLGLGSIAFSLTNGLAQGLISRALVGIAAGMAMMSCMKLGGNWFNPRQFGLVSSLVVASAAFSNFLVGRPLVAAAQTIGWRGAFGVLGGVGLILGFVIFVVLTDHPRKRPGRQEEAEGATAAVEPEIDEKPDFIKSLLLIVKTPAFWLLGTLYAFTDMIYACFTGLWAGPFLMEAYNQTEAAVGNMLSVSALGFLLAPPLWVLLARFLNSYSKVIVIMTLLNTVTALVLFKTPSDMSAASLYILCLVAPAGAQIAGMYFIMVSRLFPKNISAFSMGLTNVFAIIPGAIMQKVIGNIMSTGQGFTEAAQYRELYSAAFTPLLVCMVISVIMAVYLLKKDKGAFRECSH